MKTIKGSFSECVFEEDIHIIIPKDGHVSRCVFMADYNFSAPDGHVTINDCHFLKAKKV